MPDKNTEQSHFYPTTGFVRKSALFWMRILKNKHLISRKKKLGLIQKHFSHNTQTFEAYAKSLKTPYIERQRELTDLHYGWELKGHLGTFLKKNAFDGETLCAAHNTCEVIAVYNALVALNNEQSPVTFPELLCNFEKNGITLSGNFGTDPRSLYSYLKKNYPMYKITMHTKKQIDSIVSSTKNTEVSNTDKTTTNKVAKNNNVSVLTTQAYAYIITFWNDPKDIFYGIHTVCITENNGTFCIHNNRKENIRYSSLGEALANYANCIVSVIAISN